MRKTPTLFVRDEDRRYVTDEVTPGCEWVIEGEGRATRKYDGTCTLFDGRVWWVRREVKPGKTPPGGWVEVDHDDVTGKRVGWEPAQQSGFFKFLAEAAGGQLPGTYELCGPKINGNPESLDSHQLIRHGEDELAAPRTFGGLRGYMADFPHEGIVWHHPDGRMVKIKRRDFQRIGENL